MDFQAIVRDQLGLMVSWIEGGNQVTVTRDSAGRPLLARAAGSRSKPYAAEFRYDQSGRFLGVRGEFVSVMFPRLLEEAARGGGGDVTATTGPGGGVEFPADVQEAIIAIAGDASSGTAQIVDGYPIEVTGTSEIVVSSVPCDVVWIAHNGAAGTITLRDAATTGSGLAAAKTVYMATAPTMQAGALRTQYGVTATLTDGKATFWVRPL